MIRNLFSEVKLAVSRDDESFSNSALTRYNFQIGTGKYEGLLRALNNDTDSSSDERAVDVFSLGENKPKGSGLEVFFRSAHNRNIELFDSESQYYIADMISQKVPI